MGFATVGEGGVEATSEVEVSAETTFEGLSISFENFATLAPRDLFSRIWAAHAAAPFTAARGSTLLVRSQAWHSAGVILESAGILLAKEAASSGRSWTTA